MQLLATLLVLLRIGTPELIIIAVIVLLLFGARRIPDLMRSLGKGIREFKDASKGEEEKDKSKEE
jgi:sec-independent protein translocase protein TatA